jgi:hypothetical protein
MLKPTDNRLSFAERRPTWQPRDAEKVSQQGGITFHGWNQEGLPNEPVFPVILDYYIK